MYIILLIVLLCAGGCSSGDSIRPQPEPILQIVLAGYEYINWAWGYQHTATYIDSGGMILTAEFAREDSVWALGENGRYTEEDIARILRKAVPTGRRVEPDDIVRMYNLIEPAGRGALSRPKQVGADMGAWFSFAFLYNPESRIYKRVILDVRGDWQYHNTSSAAARLNALLKQYIISE